MGALSDHSGLENCIEERRADVFVGPYLGFGARRGRESKYGVNAEKGLWKRVCGSASGCRDRGLVAISPISCAGMG
jgi:hypothetical protein